MLSPISLLPVTNVVFYNGILQLHRKIWAIQSNKITQENKVLNPKREPGVQEVANFLSCAGSHVNMFKTCFCQSKLTNFVKDKCYFVLN